MVVLKLETNLPWELSGFNTNIFLILYLCIKSFYKF
jgi:hypothetical protein